MSLRGEWMTKSVLNILSRCREARKARSRVTRVIASPKSKKATCGGRRIIVRDDGPITGHTATKLLTARESLGSYVPPVVCT